MYFTNVVNVIFVPICWAVSFRFVSFNGGHGQDETRFENSDLH